MSTSIQIKVVGLEELETKLLAMGQEMAAKNIVGAAYAANKQVEDAAKDFIVADGLVDTGLLKKAVKRKKIVYGKDGRVVVITGINKGIYGLDKKGKPRVPWRYANVLEPKYNFMKDAMAKCRQSVIDSFTSNLLRRIKKYEKGVSMGGKS
jgi:hypothetical protein